MSAKNLFTLSLTIDRSTEDSFGCKIVKVEGMPSDMEFPKKSQMAQYSTLNIKAKKVETPKATPKAAKPEAAPVAVANEAMVQSLLASPGMASILQQMLAAQGGAVVSQQVLPPVEAPSLKAARGRPAKAK